MNYTVTYEAMLTATICPISEVITYITVEPSRDALTQIYEELNQRVGAVKVISYVADDDDYFLIALDCWV